MKANTLTIEQGLKAKQELEERIHTACMYFETFTGLSIDCVNLSKMRSVDRANSSVVSVAAVVTLGAS